MPIATSPEQPHIGAPAVDGSASERLALWAFAMVMTTVFALGAAATIASSRSMSAMGTLPMPGGWSIALSWIAPCGSTPAGALVQFVAMWLAMTATMMLPSLAPTLWRYGRCIRALGSSGCRAVAHTGAFAAAYFSTWTALGALVYACGTGFAVSVLASPSLARATPYLAAVLVMAAGALEGSAWKRHYLRCCRAAPAHDRISARGAPAAVREGVRYGWHCACCCAAPMAVMLVAGNTDIRVIVAATFAITAERLAPGGERVAVACAALALPVGGARLVQAIIFSISC